MILNQFWYQDIAELWMNVMLVVIRHNVKLFNGSQLAKMKKYIPYMSQL